MLQSGWAHPAAWQADVSLQQLQFQKRSSLPPCLTQKGLSTSILAAAASQQDTTRGVLCCDQLSWRQQRKHTQSMALNNVWLCLFNMSCGKTERGLQERMLRGAEQFEKQVEDTRPHCGARAGQIIELLQNDRRFSQPVSRCGVCLWYP
jgi:hypothetical protein